MQARVTAILVARNGAQYLGRTLESIGAQTRHPDSLVFVDAGSSDSSADLLAAAGPTQFVSAKARSSFGSALAQSMKAVGPASSDDEWLWLLSHDSAPAADALERLLGAVEIAPSVAIAGPKLMRWDAPDVIAAFGESMTMRGASVQLVNNELDQAQHDRQSDLLAVAASGMLVRRTVWSGLGGFDPGLSTVDAALDLCIRARLAGHRVVAVPTARIASDARPHGSGVVRAAQLHRRLVYAPAIALPFHWLSLVPIALLRSLWHLIAKHPGRIGGELTAALAVAFDPSIGSARRAFAASRKLGWGAIAPLRVQPGQARELAANRSSTTADVRELEGESPRPSFFASGGAWAIIVLAAIGVVAFAPFLNAPALAGGGLVPLSNSLAALWNNPPTADPFAWVLALLGSATFWAPSSGVVLLYLLAIPMAGLSAWSCAARYSTRGWAPIVAAVLWGLAPSYLVSLNDGHLGAAIAHVLLPWLLLATVNASRSWSAAGAAALLLAATVASSPVLWPVLLVGWLAWLVSHPRSIHRTIGIPLPAVVLFVPLAIAQIGSGNALSLLAEPGVPVVGGAASGWQLALGSPAGGVDGWAAVTAGLGIPPASAFVIVAALLAPLAALAVLSLFLPGSRRTIPLLALSLLGFITAVASAHLELSHLGATPVPIWAGAGLSVYWLGLVGSAVVALEALASAVTLPALLATVGAVVLAVPLIATSLAGQSAVHQSDGRMLPAFVTAESANRPTIGTLELTAQEDGSLVARVHRGAGTSLDEQSTLGATSVALSDNERDLATLAANLGTRSGFDAAPELARLGISFVLVPDAAAGAATTTRTRAADALDSNDLFVSIGATDNGYLWRYTGDVTDAKETAPDPVVPISLGLVFGLAALLAIPTGTRRRAVAAPTGDESPADTFEEDDNA
jgi:GT2 family glycosyltransferase